MKRATPKSRSKSQSGKVRNPNVSRDNEPPSITLQSLPQTTLRY